jgi:hypothetical protein
MNLVFIEMGYMQLAYLTASEVKSVMIIMETADATLGPPPIRRKTDENHII